MNESTTQADSQKDLVYLDHTSISLIQSDILLKKRGEGKGDKRKEEQFSAEPSYVTSGNGVWHSSLFRFIAECKAGPPPWGDIWAQNNTSIPVQQTSFKSVLRARSSLASQAFFVLKREKGLA